MHFMYLKHNAYCSVVFGVLPFASDCPKLSRGNSQLEKESIPLIMFGGELGLGDIEGSKPSTYAARNGAALLR